MFLSSRPDKPPSLPKHWPYPDQEDLDENPKRLINVGTAQEYYFSNNFVKTSKYELYNFIPKFLMEEFNPKTKIANCYFLLISGLQCVPAISNTGGVPTTLLPLLVVVIVDAIFQIFEDIARHRADKEANSSSAFKYSHESRKFEQCYWFEVEVGDIVKINSRDMIPADVVILGVADKSVSGQGICYVETKSLDGETNLKIRNAMPSTFGKLTDLTDYSRVVGRLECEHPNRIITSFNGILDLPKYGKEPIRAANILLRGCVLRNTEWVVGLVVNTGHDTKIMMGNTETKPKTSFLEKQASTEITRIIFLLMLFCFSGATGSAIWNNENDAANIWYLEFETSPISYWFAKFFYFFLLHASFIPVSLYVSMSVIRYFQAYFMNNDLGMYNHVTDTPSIVRTMTLNEELGQISHIFSDKTGTLTSNIMDFRKMSINGVSYGMGITEIGKAACKLRGEIIAPEVLEGEKRAKENSVPHVSFYCPNYEKVIASRSPQRRKIMEFFRVLSLCHDVIPEHIDGKLKLSASSPDDEALVCAAGYFAYQFLDKRDKYLLINNNSENVVEQVELLDTIAFTSKRKRMSVIIEEPNGTIKILTKGADSVILNRLHKGQDDMINRTDDDMRAYSDEGLRCLMICQAEMSRERYNKWSVMYKKACTSMTELEKRKAEKKNDIDDLEDEIESQLTLLGCTAIEDRLQDGVPECIAQLAASGINIWVLTGDKQETAINIAVACNLVLPPQYMEQIIINGKNGSSVEEIRTKFTVELEKFDADVENLGPSMKPRALIIDGPVLTIIMEDTQQNGCRDLLIDLSQRCRAVVGCRVSPSQKREMVALIKNGIDGVRTLAIGDGANDVPMIQEAHIGVGIKGEEGVQAVNSADYAFAQFRFLSVLVLKHGRYNYIRMTGLICYMFYKNVLMSLGQFWFNFNCGFSGQKYYTEGAIQMFNLLFTSIPILLFGIYDYDIIPSSVFKNPNIYIACIQNEYFTTSIFWGWILWAIFESIIISVVPLYTLHNSDSNGQLNTFWECGATTYTICIIVINVKLLFIQNRQHYVHYIVLGISILLWFASAFLINSVIFFDYDWYMMWNRLVTVPAFWLTILMMIVGILGKDLYLSGLERNFNFKAYHILQEMEMLASSGKVAGSVGVDTAPAASGETKQPSVQTAGGGSGSGKGGDEVSSKADSSSGVEMASSSKNNGVRGAALTA